MFEIKGHFYVTLSLRHQIEMRVAFFVFYVAPLFSVGRTDGCLCKEMKKFVSVVVLEKFCHKERLLDILAEIENEYLSERRRRRRRRRQSQISTRPTVVAGLRKTIDKLTTIESTNHPTIHEERKGM